MKRLRTASPAGGATKAELSELASMVNDHVMAYSSAGLLLQAMEHDPEWQGLGNKATEDLKSKLELLRSVETKFSADVRMRPIEHLQAFLGQERFAEEARKYVAGFADVIAEVSGACERASQAKAVLTT